MFSFVFVHVPGGVGYFVFPTWGLHHGYFWLYILFSFLYIFSRDIYIKAYIEDYIEGPRISIVLSIHSTIAQLMLYPGPHPHPHTYGIP